MMVTEIFPDKAVGNYLNSNFICLKLQMDSTDHDDQQTRMWYPDVAEIKEKYNVKNYPTFLYIDGQGTLVHRAVGFFDVDEFIRVSSNALDPKRQYGQLQKESANGDPGADFYKRMGVAALDAYDMNTAQNCLTRLIHTGNVPELLTPEGIKLLLRFTGSVKDPGFQIISDNKKTVDQFSHKNASEELIKHLITKEMVQFRELPESGRWKAMEAMVNQISPQYAHEIVAKEKIMDYAGKENWSAFIQEVSSMIDNPSITLSVQEISQYAVQLLYSSSNPTHLSAAIKWTEHTSFRDEEVGCDLLLVKACLLFKLKKTDEALNLAKIALEKAPDRDKPNIKHILEEMVKGNKFWESADK
jgi:phosphotransferase system IIB component